MNEMKWIPVKERLPEDYCRVLVTATFEDINNNEPIVGVTHYYPDSIRHPFDLGNVIAWMSIPEYYENLDTREILRSPDLPEPYKED